MVIDCEDAPVPVNTEQNPRYSEPVLTVCGREPERGRRSIDLDAVVLLQPSLAHRRASTQRATLQLIERDIVVVGKLIVRPRLVDHFTLAILHFLGLGVGVQHLARTQCIGGAELARAAHEDIIHGCDARLWLVQQRVLGYRMAARERLAGYLLRAVCLDGIWALFLDSWLHRRARMRRAGHGCLLGRRGDSRPGQGI
jgi:hypothetical protein